MKFNELSKKVQEKLIEQEVEDILENQKTEFQGYFESIEIELKDYGIIVDNISYEESGVVFELKSITPDILNYVKFNVPIDDNYTPEDYIASLKCKGEIDNSGNPKIEIYETNYTRKMYFDEEASEDYIFFLTRFVKKQMKDVSLRETYHIEDIYLDEGNIRERLEYTDEYDFDEGGNLIDSTYISSKIDDEDDNYISSSTKNKNCTVSFDEKKGIIRASSNSGNLMLQRHLVSKTKRNINKAWKEIISNFDRNTKISDIHKVLESFNIRVHNFTID